MAASKTKPKPTDTTKQSGAGGGLGGGYAVDPPSAAGTAIPTPPAQVPTTGVGRGTGGAGAGLGGGYAPPGTPTPTGSPNESGAYTSAPDNSGQPGSGNIVTPPADDIDWAAVYFGQYGLPADLVAQIEALGKKYGTTNPDVFFNSALNLIRGSDWFKVTYPGFASGVRAGLFTDETGYRGYVNQLNTVYQQYLGRHVSGDETAAALAQGATPGLIGNQFQGDAIANVNGQQWQYLTGAFDESGPLSATEKTAAGREQAGIDTPLGQLVQKRIQQASGRAAALFGGTLAAPSLSLVNGRLAAPSLGAGSPDVAA